MGMDISMLVVLYRVLHWWYYAGLQSLGISENLCLFHVQFWALCNKKGRRHHLVPLCNASTANCHKVGGFWTGWTPTSSFIWIFFLLIALCKNIFTKFTSETWAEPRWEPWDGVRVPTQIILISDSLLFFFYQQLVKKMSLKQKSSSTFYWHKRRIFATTYLLPYSLFIRIPKDYGDGICMHAHHVLHQVLCKMDHWDYL